MSTTAPTKAQEDVLAFIVRHQREKHRPPSYREIADEFGFASPFGASRHVQALVRKGFLFSTGEKKKPFAAKVPEAESLFFTIPVYGTIPAGTPADNPQQSDETIRLDPSIFGLRSARGLFALHVRGDSMIGAQIADGDLAILRRDDPCPGQIVAALIDGASTLKRLVREKGRNILRAENKRYRDITPTEGLLIQGVLVGVIGRGKR